MDLVVSRAVLRDLFHPAEASVAMIGVSKILMTSAEELWRYTTVRGWYTPSGARAARKASRLVKVVI